MPGVQVSRGGRAQAEWGSPRRRHTDAGFRLRVPRVQLPLGTRSRVDRPGAPTGKARVLTSPGRRRQPGMDDHTAGGAGGLEPLQESMRAHPVAGAFVTETLLEYDGGRQVTVYVPPGPPEA